MEMTAFVEFEFFQFVANVEILFEDPFAASIELLEALHSAFDSVPNIQKILC